MTQNILDITGDDIANLNDTDLRTLIGRLCEADYRLAGISTKGILWGGNQDAKDGGIDVDISGEVTPPSNSFVPRSNTGFQVKKPDMQPAAIKKEMCPKGVLREEIKSLIQEKGAYIIVSSTGSTTKSALSQRVKAMQDAIASEKNHQDLYVDFYDRGRVATWVRNHPSLIVWVRNKIGRHLKGWRPFENWSNPSAGIEEEYLLDDGLRLHDDSNTRENGFSVEDGLTRLRKELGVPGNSIRLVGLSGVGKTRLVQALFDDRIGNQALNQYQVFYTDMSDGPEPDPRTFAEQLIATKTQAILIVDNCPPDLHRRLTKTCSAPQSTISLLTIEYDVKDDLPEETSVFRLEPASEEIIEKLIQKRFPFISQVDSRTIATFSGGNARIAMALSNTVRKGETLSGFKDEELFERLFRQRNTENESLLKAAEVCSLVYSFEGTDAVYDTSELNILASLIGISGAELYRGVTELKKRDLVQSRNVWRAVLPHAIANRLAKRALESIPKEVLTKTFLYSPERLIKSFSRRLSYLHDCKEAVEIVDEWLGKDGWIGKSVSNFNQLGLNVFRNIAPVSPLKILEAIELVANGAGGEKFTTRENSHYADFVRILKQLAYDPTLFERSVCIMCRFALAENPKENTNSTRDALKSLFQICLSGTHAPIEIRAKVVKEFLDDANKEKQILGLYLMEAALEAWNFHSYYHDGGFGARPRDYGFHPKKREEVSHWFETLIDICTHYALSKGTLNNSIRELLADKLRGLWTNARMYEKIEESVKAIHGQRTWNEGWIAVKGIIQYDTKKFEKYTLDRLIKIEMYLRPQNLLEQARTYAVLSGHKYFELEEFYDDERDDTIYERLTKKTSEIGSKVAEDLEVFNAILPELISTDCDRVYSFGRGLAKGSSDKDSHWNALRTQFVKTIDGHRNLNVLLGFLSACAEDNSQFYHTTLDGLINDTVLGQWFPLFQTTAKIDIRGLERLHSALNTGIAAVNMYQYIAWGRSHEALNDDELAELLEKILTKENGIDVAIEILKMRFHGSSPDREYSLDLLKIGRKMMSDFEFPKGVGNHIHNLDHSLSEIAPICLANEDGKEAAQAVCKHLKLASVPYRWYGSQYRQLLENIASVQPFIFLDAFLGNPESDDYHNWRGGDDRTNPLSAISDGDILAWCDYDPANRYSVIAANINLYSVSSEGNLTWKPIVHLMLGKAPDIGAVLKHLDETIRPSSYNIGSLGGILQKRSNIFKELFSHENIEISSWAKLKYEYWQDVAAKEGESEKEEDRVWNESFE